MTSPNQRSNSVGSTDYDLPHWFWDDDTTDQERSDWMTNERARRQAMSQTTRFRLEKKVERTFRLEDAKASTVDLEKYR